MKTTKVILLSTLIFFFLAGISYAQDKKEIHQKSKTDCSVTEKSGCCSGEETAAVKTAPWNAVCPVLGNKVNPKVNTVEYNGKVYGFCCPGCDDKFQKDPEKYIQNISKDGKKYLKG